MNRVNHKLDLTDIQDLIQWNHSLRQPYQHHTSVPLKSLSESLIIQKKNYIAINSLNYSQCLLHNNISTIAISEEGSKSIVIFESVDSLNLTDVLKLNIKKGEKGILPGLLGGEDSNFVGEGDIIYFNINHEQDPEKPAEFRIVDGQSGIDLPTGSGLEGFDHKGKDSFNQSSLFQRFNKNENTRLFYSRIINVSVKLMLTIGSIRSLDGRYKLSVPTGTLCT